MENAPKIAVLVVLALVVGSIFIATSKEYSKSVSDKTVEQTNNPVSYTHLDVYKRQICRLDSCDG